VWLVLPEVAVELSEWAGFFAAGARKRALAEAGVPCVTAREADDLVREAESFVERVVSCLGVAHQPTLPTGFRVATDAAELSTD
ncbi:MAG: SAV_6107 family HEPN domain-containing protein, partial [Actinomycetota bacterium]|nr:SAV_6107 family HEPN domain-containing protein [Actinomycetota bacterium]